MKNRCSLGRVTLAVWCLMLCIGFVMATSLEVAAVPNNDAEIKKCEGLHNACIQSCPPSDAKCRSGCDQRYQIHCNPNPSGTYVCTCTSGPAAIKPSNNLPQLQPRTSQTPKAGADNPIQRRGVEGEESTPSEKEGK